MHLRLQINVLKFCWNEGRKEEQGYDSYRLQHDVDKRIVSWIIVVVVSRCAKSIAADEPTNYRLFQGLSTSTFTGWRVFQEGRENNEYATRDCAPPRIIKPLLLSSSPSWSTYLCRLYLRDVNARNVRSFTKKSE